MPPIDYRGTVEQRFWSRVKRSTPDQCWEWLGGTSDTGYGQLFVNGKVRYAHAVSHELHHGPIPKNLLVRHSCDNRVCVNPNHLLLGTHQDNSDDKIKRGRDRKALGTENGRSKLTPEQALEIDELIREGQMSLRAIGRLFNVNVNTVIALKKGVTWSHVTGRKDPCPQTWT